ncbi:ABC transporter permease subunit [Microbacterium sp.]|uniref:ABC transporter permease subunit n=1 Tax=Microbacterium sp. TaxID=51671 RepID=UPI003A849237
MTATTSAPHTARPRTQPASRLGFGRVLRSEFIKLTTVRSTWWSLAITLVLGVGISILYAVAVVESDSADLMPAILVVIAPIQLTMLVAGVLGALAVTGEYSTGMIRSTLTAEPVRGIVLVTKALAVALLLMATQLVTVVTALAATAPILSTGIDWADPGESWYPVLWSIVSMAVYALIGVGSGFLIRNGGGAISATVVLLFVLPIILAIFSVGGEAWQWVADLSQYLPASAGQELMTPTSMLSDNSLARNTITLLAWPAALLTGGWLVLRTRDA